MKIASIMAPEMKSDPVSGHRYQGWSPCMRWCEEFCEGRWLYLTEGVFEFDLASDYTLFMLRWS